MGKVSINELTLTNIGDAIREKTGKTDLIAPGDMPTEIRGIVSGGGEAVIEALEITTNGTYNAYDGVDGFAPVVVNVPQDGAPPASALNLTGLCTSRFAQGGWDWFIDMYGNQITTSNIYTAAYMFQNSQVKNIPFDINFDPNWDADLSSMFANANYLETVPRVNNVRPGNLSSLFQFASKLKEIPEDWCDTWDWSQLDTYIYTNCSAIFAYCYNLRKFPMELLSHGAPGVTSASSTVLNGTFQNCVSLDEIVGIVCPYDYPYTYGLFSSYVNGCCRLKRLTFAPAKPQKWAGLTLDLRHIGYVNSSVGWMWNETDFTEATKVWNDDTYQALKDNPDYWTEYPAYSRYNHDSAVETINSLPDCSEYQTQTSRSANNIYFWGPEGSATDGGGIDTLTEAEIAVAAAKGWTVTISR